jgi:hypothetical protein
MVRTSRQGTTRSGQTADAERGQDAAEVNEVAGGAFTGEGTKVVAQLTERAIRGRPRCLDDLVGLNNTVAHGEEPGMNKNGASQALAWMSEPEWNGESSENMSETSAGAREPESCVG